MSAEFPNAIPTNTAPSAGQKLNNPSQVDIVTKLQEEQNAIATKLGTGSSTATSGKLLRGTGPGATAFDKTAPTGDIVGDTDAQALTNKTLTTPVIPSIYQDAGKTKLMTLPNTASDTLVALNATQVLTNKTLTSPLFQGTIDGWIGTNDTHTYLYASDGLGQVTIPEGGLLKYRVGDKYKYYQPYSRAYTNDPAAGSNIVLNMTDTSNFHVGNYCLVSSSAGSEVAKITVVTTNTSITVDTLALNHTTTTPLVYTTKTTTGEKFAYITEVANTALNFQAGSDYTLENAPVLTPYYSHSNPVGFPDTFNFISTFGGFSVNPSSVTSKFWIAGKICHFNIQMGGDGTSNANTFTCTVPLVNKFGANINLLAYRGVDNGSALTNMLLVYLSNNTSTIALSKDLSGATWTTSGGKRCETISGEYPII